MEVFVSSVIRGLESYRRAARNAIQAFSTDHGVSASIVTSEHQPAMPMPPIEACRRMVQHADVVVGIYGSAYGYIDERTGKSATHLETEWALEEFFKPLLAFVVDQGEPAPEQRRLLGLIDSFRLGVYVAHVSSPEQLEFAVYRALERDLARNRAEALALAARHRFATQDLSHLALPLRCANAVVDLKTPTEEAHPLLADEVRRSLESGSELVFVLGEVGCGKTWFLKQFFLSALARHQRNRAEPWPIYVDLSQSLGPESSRQPWDWEAILGPPSPMPRLLLLDAYDEAVAKSPPGSRLRLLQSIVRLVGHDKVIVCSRSHLFETQERLARLLEAARYGHWDRSRPDRFVHTTLFVRPLAPAEVQRFLREEFHDTDGALWDRMASVIDLADLARRPVLLPMICESLGTLPPTAARGAEGPITAGGLYRIYIDHWLSRESWRLRLGEEAARDFFQDLALLFHNSATDSIIFDRVATVFPEYFPADSWSPERERVAEAVRTATFLSNNEQGQYGFVHRSFLEYFLAERCVRAIRHGELDLDLRRFPSKVTDSFILDLLVREGCWPETLVHMAAAAAAPIVRYLAVYLLARLARTLSHGGVDAILGRLAAAAQHERNPFVSRELLVTMLELGGELDATLLERHLDNPIDVQTIRTELKDYYGSMEEAARYLRQRVAPGSTERLRLFYLISLAAIGDAVDAPIFRHYAACGTAQEARVATAAISSFAEGT